MSDQRPSTKPVFTIDGDTWITEDGRRVRSTGANAPETTRGNREPGGDQATDMARRYAEGGSFEITGEDRYKRKLGRLTSADGKSFDYESARLGLTSPAFNDPTAEAGRLDAVLNDPAPDREWFAAPRSADDRDADSARMDRLRRLNLLASGGMPDRARGLYINGLAPEDGVTSRAWERGLSQGQSAIYGTANAIGNVIGSELLQDWGADGLHQAFLRSYENPPELNSLDEVEGLADFALWAYEQVISESPMLAADLAAYLSGMATGGGTVYLAQVGKGLLRGTRGMDGVTKANDLARSMRRGASIGGNTAAFTSMTAQAAGNTQQDMFNHGVTDNGWQTLMAGAGSGLVNLAAFRLITDEIAGTIKRGMDVTEASALFSQRLRDLSAEVGRNTVVGILAEGLAGAGDGLIAELNRMASIEGYEFDPANVLESTVAGGVVGGSFAGAGSTVGGAPGLVTGADLRGGDDKERGVETPDDTVARYRQSGDQGVYVSPGNVADGVTIGLMSREFPDASVYELENGGLVIADDPAIFEGLTPDASEEQLARFSHPTPPAAAPAGERPTLEGRPLNDGESRPMADRPAPEAEQSTTQTGVERSTDEATQIRQEQEALDTAARTQAGRNVSRAPEGRQQAYTARQAEAQADLDEARARFNETLTSEAERSIPYDQRMEGGARQEELNTLTAELTALGGDPNAFLEGREATDREALLAILQRERNAASTGERRNTVEGYERHSLHDLLGDRDLSSMDIAELETLARMLRVAELPKKVKTLSPMKRADALNRIRKKIGELKRGTVPNDLSGWQAAFPSLRGINRDSGVKVREQYVNEVLGAMPGEASLNARLREMSDGDVMTMLHQLGASTKGLRPSEMSASSNERRSGNVSPENSFVSELRMNVPGMRAEVNRLRATRDSYENRDQQSKALAKEAVTRSPDVQAGVVERRVAQLKDQHAKRAEQLDAEADRLNKAFQKASPKQRQKVRKALANLERRRKNAARFDEEAATVQALDELNTGKLDDELDAQKANKSAGYELNPLELDVADELGVSREQANDLFNAAATGAIMFELTGNRPQANQIANGLVRNPANAGRAHEASHIYKNPRALLTYALTLGQLSEARTRERLAIIEQLAAENPHAAADRIFAAITRLSPDNRGRYASLEQANDHGQRNPDDAFRGTTGEQAPQRMATGTNDATSQAGSREPEGLGSSVLTSTSTSYIGGDDVSPSEQSDRNFFGGVLTGARMEIDHHGAMIPFTGRDIQNMVVSGANTEGMDSLTMDRGARTIESIHRPGVQRRINTTRNTETHEGKNVAEVTMITENGKEKVFLDMITVVGYGERGDPAPVTPADYYRNFIRNVGRMSYGLTGSHYHAKEPFFKQAVIDNFNFNSNLVIAGDTADSALTLGQAREAYRRELEDKNLAAELANEIDRINIEREELVPILDHYLEEVERRLYAERQAAERGEQGAEARALGYEQLRLELEEKLGETGGWYGSREEGRTNPGEAPGGRPSPRTERIAALERELADVEREVGADSELAQSIRDRLTILRDLVADSPEALELAIARSTEVLESILVPMRAELETKIAKLEQHDPDYTSPVVQAETELSERLDDLYAALGDEAGPASYTDLTMLVLDTAREIGYLEGRESVGPSSIGDTPNARNRDKAYQALLDKLSTVVGGEAGSPRRRILPTVELVNAALDAAKTVMFPVVDARIAHLHQLAENRDKLQAVQTRMAEIEAGIAGFQARLETDRGPETTTEGRRRTTAPEPEVTRPNLSTIGLAKDRSGEYILPTLEMGPYTEQKGVKRKLNPRGMTSLKMAMEAFDRTQRRGRELRDRIRDFATTADDTNKAFDLFVTALMGDGMSRREARLVASRYVEVTDAETGKDEGAVAGPSAFNDDSYGELTKNDIFRSIAAGDVSSVFGSFYQADSNGVVADANLDDDLSIAGLLGDDASFDPQSSNFVLDHLEADPVRQAQAEADITRRSKLTRDALEAHLEQWKESNPEAFEAFQAQRMVEWAARNPQLKRAAQERAQVELAEQGEGVTQDDVDDRASELLEQAYAEDPNVYASNLDEFYRLLESGKLQGLRNPSVRFFFNLNRIGKIRTQAERAAAAAQSADAAGIAQRLDNSLRRFFGDNKKVRYEGTTSKEVSAFVDSVLEQFQVTDRPTLVTVGRTTKQTLDQIREAGLLSDEDMSVLEAQLEGVEADIEPMYLSVGDFSIVTMPPLPTNSGARGADQLNNYRWFHQLGHELGHLVFDEYKASIMLNRDQGDLLVGAFEADMGKPLDSQYDMKLFDEWFADKAANEALARFTEQQRGEVGNVDGIFSGLIDQMVAFFNKVNELLYVPLSSGLRRFVRTSRDANMFLVMADNIQRGVYATRIQRPDPSFRTDRIYSRQYKGGDEVLDNKFKMHQTRVAAAVNKATFGASGMATKVLRTVFTDNIYRIGLYSKELAQALHQRTGAGRGEGGGQAFSQKEISIGRTLTGELYRALKPVLQGVPRKQQGKAIREAIQRYERTNTGPIAAFMESANQIAERNGFRSIPGKLGLPAALNHDGVMKNETAFMEMLHEAFPNENANQLQNRLRVLQMTHGMSEFAVAPGLPVGSHDTTRVLLDKIGHTRLREAGFLHDKSEATLLHFIDGLAKRTAWESTFGGFTHNTRMNYDRFVVGHDPDRDQLKNAGLIDDDGRVFDPSAKYYEHLDSIEKRHGINARQEVERMMAGAMGTFASSVPKGVRSAIDWTTSFVSKTILAFAGIMTLPELALPVVRAHGRVGLFDGLSGFSEAREMVKDMGMVVTDAWENIAWHSQGDNYESSAIRKIDQVYFKAIGMKLVMDTSRTLGVAFGTRYFLNSAKLNDTNALSQFGLTVGDVSAWDNAGRPTSLNTGDPRMDAITEKMQHALSQFVSESSATPNRFQAPGWFNNPYLKVFWMVKRYMYAYADNLIGGIIRMTRNQWERGNGYADKAILATLPLAMFGLVMMPMAMATDELRERMRPYLTGRPGKTMDQYESLGQYAGQVFDRTGGFGPLGIALQMREQSEWGMSPWEASSPVFAKAKLLYDWGETGISGDKVLTRARHFIPILSQTPRAWNAMVDAITQ